MKREELREEIARIMCGLVGVPYLGTPAHKVIFERVDAILLLTDREKEEFSSRDHAPAASFALDIERLHQDIARRYPNILAALHRAELAESSAKRVEGTDPGMNSPLHKGEREP